MSRTRLQKQPGAVPPQLIGIMADAVGIGATSFRLKPNPPYTTACFASGSQAHEIDFEAWSGREMMNFLRHQVTDVKQRTGRFEVECNSKRYLCHVAVDRMRNPAEAEVTWA